MLQEEALLFIEVPGDDNMVFESLGLLFVLVEIQVTRVSFFDARRCEEKRGEVWKSAWHLWVAIALC